MDLVKGTVSSKNPSPAEEEKKESFLSKDNVDKLYQRDELVRRNLYTPTAKLLPEKALDAKTMLLLNNRPKPKYGEYGKDYQAAINNTTSPAEQAELRNQQQKKIQFMMNNDLEALAERAETQQDRDILTTMQKDKRYISENPIPKTAQEYYQEALYGTPDYSDRVKRNYDELAEDVRGNADNYENWARSQLDNAKVQAQIKADQAMKAMRERYYAQDVPEMRQRVANMGLGSGSGFGRQENLALQQSLMNAQNEITAQQNQIIADAQARAEELIAQGRLQEAEQMLMIGQNRANALDAERQNRTQLAMQVANMLYNAQEADKTRRFQNEQRIAGETHDMNLQQDSQNWNREQAEINQGYAQDNLRLEDNITRGQMALEDDITRGQMALKHDYDIALQDNESKNNMAETTHAAKYKSVGGSGGTTKREAVNALYSGYINRLYANDVTGKAKYPITEESNEKLKYLADGKDDIIYNFMEAGASKSEAEKLYGQLAEQVITDINTAENNQSGVNPSYINDWLTNVGL